MSDPAFDPTKPPPSAEPPAPPPRIDPVARIEKSSILEVVENEPCPNCKASLPMTAVVCLKCGYDLVTGKVRKTELGTEVVPEKPTTSEFVQPGRLNAKVLTAIGGVLTIAGVVAAMYYAPVAQSFGPRLAAGVLVVYENLLHTGTGALAVAGTALALNYKVTRIDLVLARVFLAFAAMQVVSRCNVPIDQAHEVVKALAVGGRWIVALGAYWVALWALFRRSPLETSMIGAVHMVVILITQAASMLELAAKG